MPCDDLGEDVAQVGGGLDTVELGGLGQGCDGGSVFGAAIGSGEEMILSAKGNGPDRALDGVGVHLDPAVGEEEGQAGPPAEAVADGSGQRALAGDEGE